MTPTTLALPVSSQYLLELIRGTDLLSRDEKEKFAAFLGSFSQEEKNLLAVQIVKYEQRKAELYQDAEKRRREIEEAYYQELLQLHREESHRLREEMHKREEEDQQAGNQAADDLLAGL